MIEVRYSLSEAIEITGTQKELEAFRRQVLGFLKTDLEKIRIEIEKDIILGPWDAVAKGLEVVQSDKPVKVSVSGDKIVKIEGSNEGLDAFTSFLVFDENAVSGHHSHYEYYDYEGNVYVHLDSFPLIIGVK
jgi:hypothetical protein